MLRIIALSLMLVLSVGVMLPCANEAHGVRQSTQIGLRRHHRYHSRAWWRRYRARLRQKREAAAAILAHRKALLALPQNIPVSELNINELRVSALPALSTVNVNNLPTAPASSVKPVEVKSSPARASEVKSSPARASEAKPAVKSVSAKLPGQMNLSVVALSRQNPVFLTAREESKLLGGTNVAELRRIVIDKMIVAGGWVINDFVREVNGARVFVVTARTPKDASSPEKAWTFYFTEADGRIYGLTTDAPVDSADRMSTEAERLINKLHAAPQN